MLPKHVLEGRNFNKVWNTCICDPKTKKPIGSGPMLVQSFKPDQQVTLVPNPNYWGNKATVPKVVFIPITDSNTRDQRVPRRRGRHDLPAEPDRPAQEDRSRPTARSTRSTLGPQWEHFDMLTTVPGLDDLAVRKAIATALPRQQIVDRVVKDANDDAAGPRQHACG